MELATLRVSVKPKMEQLQDLVLKDMEYAVYVSSFLDLKLESKYPLHGYILGVLRHITTWYQHCTMVNVDRGRV